MEYQHQNVRFSTRPNQSAAFRPLNFATDETGRNYVAFIPNQASGISKQQQKMYSILYPQQHSPAFATPEGAKIAPTVYTNSANLGQSIFWQLQQLFRQKQLANNKSSLTSYKGTKASKNQISHDNGNSETEWKVSSLFRINVFFVLDTFKEISNKHALSINSQFY